MPACLQVAVVLALSLPFFALSFGHSVLPSTSEMDAAAQQLSDNIERLAPWELCVLVWGVARLGYAPSRQLMAVAVNQASASCWSAFCVLCSILSSALHLEPQPQGPE